VHQHTLQAVRFDDGQRTVEAEAGAANFTTDQRPEAATPTRYAGRSGFLKGVLHSLFRKAPPVDCERDPADYSVVIIGSPVWAGRLSAPMRSYLTRFPGRIGPVAALWVSGSGLAYKKVRAEIEQLTGRTLLTAASFTEQEVRGAAADAKGGELDPGRAGVSARARNQF
jgi:hypothetical protein